jgi:hypothetical protein
MSTFNINPDFSVIEKLRDLAETTENIHEIPCGAISFNIRDFPQLDCMSLAEVGGFAQVGDLVAEIGARQLQSVLIYPRDSDRSEDEILERRFWLEKVPTSRDLYEINDTENDPELTGFCVWIEKSYLLDDKFNFPLWYAAQRAINKGIEFESLPMTYWLDFQMGDVYAHGLAWRLMDGASQFPEPLIEIMPEERFSAYE